MFVTLVDMVYCMLFFFFCWAARALGALPRYEKNSGIKQN